MSCADALMLSVVGRWMRFGGDDLRDMQLAESVFRPLSQLRCSNSWYCSLHAGRMAESYFSEIKHGAFSRMSGSLAEEASWSQTSTPWRRLSVSPEAFSSSGMYSLRLSSQSSPVPQRPIGMSPSTPPNQTRRPHALPLLSLDIHLTRPRSPVCTLLQPQLAINGRYGRHPKLGEQGSSSPWSE